MSDRGKDLTLVETSISSVQDIVKKLRLGSAVGAATVEMEIPAVLMRDLARVIERGLRVSEYEAAAEQAFTSAAADRTEIDELLAAAEAAIAQARRRSRNLLVIAAVILAMAVTLRFLPVAP